MCCDNRQTSGLIISTGGAARHAGLRRLLWTGMLLLGLLLIGATTYICLSNTPMLAEYRKLAIFYSSKRALREYLKSFGADAPLAFVAIQALQVVVSPIPGELTGVLGGYLFGTWLGFAYSTVGLTVGSIMAFLLARWLGGCRWCVAWSRMRSTASSTSSHGQAGSWSHWFAS